MNKKDDGDIEISSISDRYSSITTLSSNISTLEKYSNTPVSKLLKFYNYFYQLSTKNKILGLLFVIFVYIVFYIVIAEIYTMTYVWQLTILGSYLFPIHRNTCNFLQPDSRNFFASIPKTGVEELLPVRIDYKNKLSIGMVYLFGESEASSSWTTTLINRILDNRRKYCDKYGYTLLNGNGHIDPTRPIAWSKLLAVKFYLPKYDYIIYIDMDIVILNFDIKLENFIKIPDKPIDFLMTNDWNGPNTGVWLVRNSKWSLWFLEELFKQKQLVSKRSSKGIAHPFEYEQRAFHYLLYSKVWKKRKLPVYSGSIESIRNHFYFFPQCAFNSYCLHPFDWRGDREIRHYSSGDFLIHFPGVKGQKKVNLMNYYLTVAENMPT